MKPFHLTAVILLLISPLAWAGPDEGKAALEKGDYETAIREFQNSSSDPESQYHLGFMYANGLGVPENDTEAVKWYRKAAEQGHADAQFILNTPRMLKKAAEQEDAEAQDLFDRFRSIFGDAVAAALVGDMYNNGRGVAQDYTKAVKWYRKAAEQGLADAQFNLGLMYANGEGVAQDYAEAVKWYRMAAEQGLAEAQNNLGVMYHNGEGVARDYTEAVKWFRKAAEQGLAKAQFNLGLMYIYGEGVAKSPFVAADWLYKAGKAYLKEGNREKALEAVDVINKAAPEHFLAKELMAAIYGEKRDEPGEGGERGAASGTAFTVAKGYVVTCFHVVKDHASIILHRADGKTMKADIAVADRANDIAILKVDDPGELAPALPVSAIGARPGAGVFTVGYPMTDIMGAEPKVSSGVINSVSGFMDDPRVYQISVPVQAGNSGGPLLNMKGETVGIVVAKLNAAVIFQWTGDLPQNVNYAVKSEYLNLLLKNLPDIGRLGIHPAKEGDLEDLAARLKDSILMVTAE